MTPPPPPHKARAGEDGARAVREHGGLLFYRLDAESGSYAFRPASSATERPSSQSVQRLTHEFGLRAHLDASWALTPTELIRDDGHIAMRVDWPDGEWLDQLVGTPMETGRFLRIAAALAGALVRLHASGLVHKDIKPANVVVNIEAGSAWLTGFGIASPQRRDRQLPEPPEHIAGTLAYMAPEQTGRMNRSIDSRSDLDAFGVVLYQMLTGSLPFSGEDAMDWVHCHVARQPVAPAQRRPDVPATVSAITMKLLAKTAEARYQTAAAAERDLRRCEVAELMPDERRRIRQEQSRKVADALQHWLAGQRQRVPDGSATARAIDYSLKRWKALTRYIDDGDLPAENNWVEKQIRPIAIGRSNWLFAGSLRAGQRAAAIMSLIQSAKLNGHEPYAYLSDILERLPTQPASRVAELLPDRGPPA